MSTKINKGNKQFADNKFLVDGMQEAMFGTYLHKVLSLPNQQPLFVSELYDNYFRNDDCMTLASANDHRCARTALQKHLNVLRHKNLVVTTEVPRKGRGPYVKYAINKKVSPRAMDFVEVNPRDEVKQRKTDAKTGNGKMVAVEQPTNVLEAMSEIVKELSSPTEQMPLSMQPGGIIPEPHVAPLQELLSEVTGMKKTIESLQFKVNLLEQANKELSTSAISAHRLAKEAKSIASSARGRR